MTRKRSKSRKEEVKSKNTPSSSSENIYKQVRIKPRSKNQRELLRSIYNKDITFCVGPAGTGKTHVSVGAAVDLFQKKRITKIIITRPMIEANQSRHGNKSVMGYLPGSIEQKMAPYLRPLYDELGKFLTPAMIKLMMANNTIEICPLAFMRGRTFENAFVLCDEAQNATEEELEMLLTRLGTGSKMIVSGDVDQSDLPSYLEGGLENFIEDLDGIDGLGIIYLETQDVQRLKIVRDIIERRKQVKAGLAAPASLERVGYERKDTESPSKNSSFERKYDATSGYYLDGSV